jgi:hypothetical protein
MRQSKTTSLTSDAKCHSLTRKAVLMDSFWTRQLARRSREGAANFTKQSRVRHPAVDSLGCMVLLHWTALAEGKLQRVIADGAVCEVIVEHRFLDAMV